VDYGIDFEPFSKYTFLKPLQALTYRSLNLYKPTASIYVELLDSITLGIIGFKKFLKNFASKFKHLTL
jgi:hypothetical protein